MPIPPREFSEDMRDAGSIFFKILQNTRHLYLGKVRKFKDDRLNGSEAACEKLPGGQNLPPQGIGLIQI